MITDTSTPPIASDRNYQVTLQRLLELNETDCEADEDDWGATRPSAYAFDLARKILEGIENAIAPKDFPLGFSSLDSTGGIDLIWKNHKTENEVSVTIPEDDRRKMLLYIDNYENCKSKLFSYSAIEPLIDQFVKVLNLLHN